MLHGIAYWLGLTNAGGTPYLFWSGIMGDLGMIGGVAVLWRHLECHADGCHRPALHHVHGTQFKVCRGHHPTGGNSAQDIKDAHEEATG